jgi:hypothetical protein
VQGVELAFPSRAVQLAMRDDLSSFLSASKIWEGQRDKSAKYVNYRGMWLLLTCFAWGCGLEINAWVTHTTRLHPWFARDGGTRRGGVVVHLPRDGL